MPRLREGDVESQVALLSEWGVDPTRVVKNSVSLEQLHHRGAVLRLLKLTSHTGPFGVESEEVRIPLTPTQQQQWIATYSTPASAHTYLLHQASDAPTPYEHHCRQEAECIRVVDAIRAEIPYAAVFFHQLVVSVRATENGTTNDLVLVPGDKFTITGRTITRD